MLITVTAADLLSSGQVIQEFCKQFPGAIALDYPSRFAFKIPFQFRTIYTDFLDFMRAVDKYNTYEIAFSDQIFISSGHPLVNAIDGGVEVKIEEVIKMYRVAEREFTIPIVNYLFMLVPKGNSDRYNNIKNILLTDSLYSKFIKNAQLLGNWPPKDVVSKMKEIFSNN